MLAFVLVAKYAWHLPLYRQSQMLAAQGLDITRAVLAFWVGYAATELKPVYVRLRELILASGKIAVDETVAPVLDPGRGRTKQGYFWAVARDDRPWGGTDPPAIAFSYVPPSSDAGDGRMWRSLNRRSACVYLDHTLKQARAWPSSCASAPARHARRARWRQVLDYFPAQNCDWGSSVN